MLRQVRLALEASFGLAPGALKGVQFRELLDAADEAIEARGEAAAGGAPSPASSAATSSTAFPAAADAAAAAASRPPNRLLTLGSDVEELKHEGERLEVAYGRDVSNGWLYRHALTKLAILQ